MVKSMRALKKEEAARSERRGQGLVGQEERGGESGGDKSNNKLKR